MTSEKRRNALFWFRRDLRLNDNLGLFHALQECDSVAPIFIFDKNILDELPLADRRVEFIWNCIKDIKNKLNNVGSDIIVKYGYAEKEIVNLANKFKVHTVYANEDYEPKARERDGKVQEQLNLLGIEFKTYKDTVIFSKNEVLNNIQPYTVFTAYKNAWKRKLTPVDYKIYDIQHLIEKFSKYQAGKMIALESMGFQKTNLSIMKLEANAEGAEKLFNRFTDKVIPNYKVLRDIPFTGGVSYLSMHNRFGTISIRLLVSKSMKLISAMQDKRKESCEAWLDELIWREFYMQLLYHFPHIAYEPFKVEFQNFPWENNPLYYIAWCEGKTGFPLIDAAMMQLNKTGYMHNRLRMLVASFLTKHLLTDYTLGEEYFATKLLDYDLSANNGGWQWAASTGCDSQPYVRIFNPVKQSEKFDSEARFIKKYLPIFQHVPSVYLHEPWKYIGQLKELGIELGKDYPMPIVQHEERRKHALKIFEENSRLEKLIT